MVLLTSAKTRRYETSAFKVRFRTDVGLQLLNLTHATKNIVVRSGKIFFRASKRIHSVIPIT